MNIINKVDATMGEKYLTSMVDFQEKLALESEELVLDRDTLTNGISRVISDSTLGEYYLSFGEDDSLQGMLLTLPEWSDWRCAKVLWIHSVYIDQKFRRQGVFAEMYKHLKSLVKQNSEYAGLRLYVDKTNHVALKVYEDLGMTDEHYSLFEWLKD